MKYLYEVLDKKNYLKLTRMFGGSRIWIPKEGNTGHRDQRFYISRDSKIRKLRKKGKSVGVIAEMYGLSLKRVYSIAAAGAKKRRKRPALFR